MAATDETVRSVVEANAALPGALPSSKTRTGVSILFGKTTRTILLTILLSLLPLAVPRLAALINFKGESYREILPKPRDLISFRHSADSSGELPGGPGQNITSAEETVVEPPAGAGSFVDPMRALDSFYARLAQTDAKVPGAITRITHYGDS